MAVNSLHDHTGPSPVPGPQADGLTTGTAPHLPKLGERQALGFIAQWSQGVPSPQESQLSFVGQDRGWVMK